MKCPQCGKELHIDEKYAGQSGRCEHCEQSITVPGGFVSIQPPIGHRQSKEIQHGIKIRNPVAHGFGFGCGIMLLLFVVFVVAPISFIILSAIGIFSTLDNKSPPVAPIVAGGARQDETVAPIVDRVARQTEVPRSPLEDILRTLTGGAPVTPEETIAPVAEPPDLVTLIGDEYQSDLFSISVVSAKVDYPKLLNLRAQEQVGTEKQLLIYMKIKNTDARKILQFDAETYRGSHFTLSDDVENRIRGVSYGFMLHVVSALGDGEDIYPGTSVEHVEVFVVPPPKTEYLNLNIDLAILGDEGEAIIRIPVESIEGFSL